MPIALECGAGSGTAGVVGNVSDLLAVADACVIKATDSNCGLATASLIAPYWSKAMTDAAVETVQSIARTGESLVTSAEKAGYALETFWNPVSNTLGLREEDE
ncbi:MAG: hypothetical protein OEW30_17380 [Acidimicrobiia bacterium]|nr:hypothetical protein [Acidimicrobiia bacterium]